MISCLIVYECDHLTETIKIILEEKLMFFDNELTEENNQIITYLWNIEKEVVWQIALLFEMSSIIVGYGFNEYKDKAREQAEIHLINRLAMEKN